MASKDGERPRAVPPSHGAGYGLADGAGHSGGYGSGHASHGGNEELRHADADSRAAIAKCFEQIVARDAAGLRDLINLTQHRIRAIAFRLLGDGGEADEIVQDVYLTVWDKAQRYDAGRAHGMAWLTVIARNRCLDRLRQRRTRRHLAANGSDVLLVQGLHEGEDEGEGEVERHERLDRLTASLEGLEPGTRDAIKAAFFDGHTYEELARAHDVPLGTMKSRIRRGLLALRSVLGS